MITLRMTGRIQLSLSPWCSERVLKKGMVFRRKSDGYLFCVESASRLTNTAYMQCVDALQVFGSFTGEQIMRDFDRVITPHRSSKRPR